MISITTAFRRYPCLFELGQTYNNFPRHHGIVFVLNISFNPIETVWNKMKDYDQLREAVKAAWEWFPKEELQELVRSMKSC